MFQMAVGDKRRRCKMRPRKRRLQGLKKNSSLNSNDMLKTTTILFIPHNVCLTCVG